MKRTLALAGINKLATLNASLGCLRPEQQQHG